MIRFSTQFSTMNSMRKKDRKERAFSTFHSDSYGGVEMEKPSSPAKGGVA